MTNKAALSSHRTDQDLVDTTTNFTVNANNNLNEEHVAWLTNEIQSQEGSTSTDNNRDNNNNNNSINNNAKTSDTEANISFDTWFSSVSANTAASIGASTVQSDTDSFAQNNDSSSSSKDVPLVVLTHHAPTPRGTIWPHVVNSPTVHRWQNNRNLAYVWSHLLCSDYCEIEHLMGPPVALWCHGHTHYNHPNYEHVVNKTRIISNQLGTKTVLK